MRPRREVLLTTFADPSTFPSVFETPAHSEPTTAQPVTAESTPATAEADTTPVADAATADDIQPTESIQPAAQAAPAVDAEPASDAVPAAEVATEIASVTFGDLGVPSELVRVLTREGIRTPFEIQVATIPDALAGRDVLGRGQTGSGKTLAFGLALLARVAQGGRAKPLQPKALILVPTRELAMQVADALTPLGRAVGVFLKTAVGGVPYDRQVDALRRGVEVIVATPGRLGDLIERGVC